MLELMIIEVLNIEEMDYRQHKTDVAHQNISIIISMVTTF